MNFYTTKEVKLELPRFYKKGSKEVTVKCLTTGSRYLDDFFKMGIGKNPVSIEKNGLKFLLFEQLFNITAGVNTVYSNTPPHITVKEIKNIIKHNIEPSILTRTIESPYYYVSYNYPEFTVTVPLFKDDVTSSFNVEGFLTIEEIDNRLAEIKDRLDSINLVIGASGTTFLAIGLLRNFEGNKHKCISCYNDEFRIEVTSDILDIDTTTLRFVIKLALRYALTGIVPNMFCRVPSKSANY